MAFVRVNPNPENLLTGDCVIRAISIATGKSWDETYLDLMACGYRMKDIPNANWVWGVYLHNHGFRPYLITDYVKGRYTINDFTRDCPDCVGVLATGSHVVAIRNGDHMDTWDSGNEVPLYYWRKEN